ncbi:Terpene synthase [Quillaja saponaria]|uniref:Terpene synthase n=1 Tax=Quillaja saponaria TaxID=32244 RepID=A0AAD7PGE0_QUISA|nr:Terpene synthase [Quillaja saponaria]
MLSLYEAAHLSIRGEDILDEALDFSTYHLKSMVSSTEMIIPQYLKEKVIHALRWPIRKSLPRLDTRYYISIYPKEDGFHESLLKFAKLDFNMLQALYQDELKSFTEWWQKSDLVDKLPYARVRIEESYFWGSMATFAPQYTISRYMAAQMVSVLAIVDDNYDAYGTIEELKLLTQAIQRWDSSSMDFLPDSMKLVYRDVILETFTNFESLTAKDGQSQFLHYAIEAFKRIARAYLQESEWCNKGYVPTYEEYIEISTVTGCQELLSEISFLGMGNSANKDVFDWATSNSKNFSASNIIARLMGDIGTHKFEQKRKHVATSVECYTKQHGITEAEAIKVLEEEVRNAWKDINEDCLKPTTVPVPMIECLINFVRVMNLLYENESDKFTNTELLKDYISSLFVNPILI